MAGPAFVEVRAVSSRTRKKHAGKGAEEPHSMLRTGNVRHISRRRDMRASKQVKGRLGRPLCNADRKAAYYNSAGFDERCLQLNPLTTVEFDARPVCEKCKAIVDRLRTTCTKTPYSSRSVALKAMEAHNEGGRLARRLTGVFPCPIHEGYWHTTSK